MSLQHMIKASNMMQCEFIGLIFYGDKLILERCVKQLLLPFLKQLPIEWWYAFFQDSSAAHNIRGITEFLRIVFGQELLVVVCPYLVFMGNHEEKKYQAGNFC
jgi:hypothetical protein